MSATATTKEQLLQGFAAGYERIIQKVTEAEQQGVRYQADTWGSREVIAHLAGWEIMATIRIPKIIVGMPPAEFGDAAQTTVMNNAINAAFITLKGEQPLVTLCAILRQAYQQTVELLEPLDTAFFQPGEYIYERTKGVIEHCQEHMDQLDANVS